MLWLLLRMEIVPPSFRRHHNALLLSGQITLKLLY